MNEDDPPAIGKMLLAGIAALAMLVLLFLAVKASAQDRPGITVLAKICLGDSPCKDVPVTNSLLDNRVTMTSCQMGAPELAQWMTKNWPGYRFAGWKCVIGGRRVDL